MATSPWVIIVPSGTGKSYYVKTTGKAVDGDKIAFEGRKLSPDFGIKPGAEKEHDISLSRIFGVTHSKPILFWTDYKRIPKQYMRRVAVVVPDAQVIYDQQRERQKKKPHAWTQELADIEKSIGKLKLWAEERKVPIYGTIAEAVDSVDSHN